MKALVVLSGGQDSTTCLAEAVSTLGEANVAAITFNYGQRHAIELQAARDVALLLGVKQHEVLDIGPILKGTSPLTAHGEQLETYENFSEMDAIIGDRVEKTFVPMRNALFLTLAANRAVCMGATQIWTGVCQADNANYPDCRQSFVKAQETAINEALGSNTLEALKTGGGYIDIVTPLMNLTKAQSIERMRMLGHWSLLAFTHTAYDGAYPPVGKDHASLLRAQGFLEANVADPLVVRANMEGLMELPGTRNYTEPQLEGLRLMITSAKGRLSALSPQRSLVESA